MTSIDHRRLALLLERVGLDVADGTLPSAQVAVALHGEVLAFETFGDATPSTRYITQSAGRPILAAVMWKLLGDGLLDVDQPVASVLEPFAANGKERVTYRHLLTHTAGFPMAGIRYPAMTERAQRLAAMARWRLDTEPGTSLRYHLTSAAWVIADTVEELTGLPLRDYLRHSISEPLGLTIELGVPVEDQARSVAPMRPIGDLPPDWEPDPWGPWFFRDPEVLAAGEPSHTICATAADAVRLLQAIHHGDGFDREVVRLATGPVVTMPMEGDYGGTGELASKGLFVNIEGPPTTSPSTWGHGGAPSSVMWHDPEPGLSFAYFTNGYPPEGYDATRSGRNRATVLGTLAGDVLVDRSPTGRAVQKTV